MAGVAAAIAARRETGRLESASPRVGVENGLRRAQTFVPPPTSFFGGGKKAVKEDKMEPLYRMMRCIERGPDGGIAFGEPHAEKFFTFYPDDPRWAVMLWKQIYIPFWLGFSLISTPFQFIDQTTSDVVGYITYFAEFNFVLDMVCSFRTAFIHNMPSERFLVDEGKLMAVHYSKSWLIVDLCSSLAFVLTSLLQGYTNETFQNLVLPLLVFRLLRVARLGAFFYQITKNLSAEARTFSRLLQILGLVFVIAHW
jgi:hypothetical protein